MRRFIAFSISAMISASVSTVIESSSVIEVYESVEALGGSWNIESCGGVTSKEDSSGSDCVSAVRMRDAGVSVVHGGRGQEGRGEAEGGAMISTSPPR